MTCLMALHLISVISTIIWTSTGRYQTLELPILWPFRLYPTTFKQEPVNTADFPRHIKLWRAVLVHGPWNIPRDPQHCIFLFILAMSQRVELPQTPLNVSTITLYKSINTRPESKGPKHQRFQCFCFSALSLLSASFLLIWTHAR